MKLIDADKLLKRISEKVGCSVSIGGGISSAGGVTRIIHEMLQEKEMIYIPDNATNGEVIKTIFADEICDLYEGNFEVVYYDKTHERHDFLAEWWNAPYKKGGTE